MDQKSEKTLENYQSTINRLKTMFGGTFIGELSNANKVIEKINKEYDNLNTRRSYFSRIMKLIKENPKWKVPNTALKKYQNAFQQLEKKRIAQEDSNEPTPKEKANWVPFDKLMELREELGPKAKSFNGYQDYLIMSLYTMNPPVRLDYTPMKVITRLTKNIDKSINYLLWSKGQKKFIFNNYKTERFHGPNEIKITGNLQKIIQTWFDKYNPKKQWLLLDKNKEDPMTQNGLSQRVRAIIEKHTGKKAGVSMMRHSFISTMINGMTNLKTRKRIAKQMGHTVLEQLKYKKFI